MKKLAGVVFFLFSLFLLSACGGGDLFEEDNVDYSGGGTAPSSILNYTVVQTVSRSGLYGQSGEVIQAGESITYTFVDSSTVLGDGMVTLPTSSWSYRSNGSSGVVTLNYSSGSYSVDTYTFTSTNGGTYRSEMTLATGSRAWQEGTFVVYGANGGSGGYEALGQIIFWTTVSDAGSISIYVDGTYQGKLTQYFYSSGSAPACGDTGGLTLTLSEGSHSFTAEDENFKVWGGAFMISDGTCLTQLIY